MFGLLFIYNAVPILQPFVADSRLEGNDRLWSTLKIRAEQASEAVGQEFPASPLSNSLANNRTQRRDSVTHFVGSKIGYALI